MRKAKIKIDLTGKQYGKWTVLGYHSQNASCNSVWECVCSCGNRKLLSSTNLRYSKGCELCGNARHKMSNTREYRSWISMKSRCNNKNHKHFNHYGGRGIKICPQWLNSFACFYKDMGDAPDGFSIDRINVDGDYEPGNCRWASNAEQSRNRKTNKFDMNDARKIRERHKAGESCKQIADSYGTNVDAISRIVRGVRWAE